MAAPSSSSRSIAATASPEPFKLAIKTTSPETKPKPDHQLTAAALGAVLFPSSPMAAISSKSDAGHPQRRPTLSAASSPPRRRRRVRSHRSGQHLLLLNVFFLPHIRLCTSLAETVTPSPTIAAVPMHHLPASFLPPWPTSRRPSSSGQNSLPWLSCPLPSSGHLPHIQAPHGHKLPAMPRPCSPSPFRHRLPSLPCICNPPDASGHSPFSTPPLPSAVSPAQFSHRPHVSGLSPVPSCHCIPTPPRLTQMRCYCHPSQPPCNQQPLAGQHPFQPPFDVERFGR